MEYMLEHHATILGMFPNDPWDECSLMILKSTTRTISWCRGLARKTAGTISGAIGLHVPMTGIPVLSLDAGTQQAVLHHVRYSALHRAENVYLTSEVVVD